MDNIERDLDMMKNPDRWPMWPFLPLMGRNGVGLLLEEGSGYTVILANLCSSLEVKLKAKRIKYGSAEDVIADGYRVD